MPSAAIELVVQPEIIANRYDFPEHGLSCPYLFSMPGKSNEPGEARFLFPHPGPLPKEREAVQPSWDNPQPPLMTPTWHQFSLSPRERAGVRGNETPIPLRIENCPKR